jgi:hypothetical protein
MRKIKDASTTEWLYPSMESMNFASCEAESSHFLFTPLHDMDNLATYPDDSRTKKFPQLHAMHPP